MIGRPNDSFGQFVSQFVAERVDAPQPCEIDIWTELVCGELFSVAFVCWLPRVKTHSSREQIDTELSHLINEIANHANVWMNIKLRRVLADQNRLAQIEGSRRVGSQTDRTGFVRARLNAMFEQAISGMTEKKFDPEVARSHAYFVILSQEPPCCQFLYIGGFYQITYFVYRLCYSYRLSFYDNRNRNELCNRNPMDGLFISKLPAAGCLEEFLKVKEYVKDGYRFGRTTLKIGDRTMTELPRHSRATWVRKSRPATGGSIGRCSIPDTKYSLLNTRRESNSSE